MENSYSKSLTQFDNNYSSNHFGRETNVSYPTNSLYKILIWSIMKYQIPVEVFTLKMSS